MKLEVLAAQQSTIAFRPGKLDTLKFLQFTGTVMMQFPIDIHVNFPALKVLDISHDMENVLCTVTDGSLTCTSTYFSFLTEALLFHPSLELFISVNNI